MGEFCFFFFGGLEGLCALHKDHGVAKFGYMSEREIAGSQVKMFILKGGS